jgi:polar amino acid transport system substrate-binding protein
MRKSIIILILCNFISSISFADTSKQTKLSMTGHPDYPPIIWFSKKEDKLLGVAVEAAESFLKELNYSTKNTPISTWARALKEVARGKIDIILPPYKTKSRELEYHYTKKPFFMDETVIFLKKGKNIKYEKLSDLKKYKGAAIINDSFGDKFDKYDKDVLKIKRLAKTEQCFKFLLRGRADYIVAGKNAGKSVLAKMKLLDKVVIHKNRILETGMYLGISLKSKVDINKVAKHFEKRTKEWHQQGKFKKLEKKYFDIYLNEVSVKN